VTAVIVWLLPLGTGAAEKSGAEEPVEVVEEVEVVEAVEVVDTGGDGAGFTFQQLIGRNHPALVHLPIGLLMGVLLLELLALFFPSLPLGRSPMVLSLAALASFFPAAVSGFVRSSELFANTEAPSMFFEHRNLMIGAAVLLAAAVAIRLAKRDNLEGIVRWVHLVLIILAVLLTAVGGHHGGQLVYGESFLPY
jgi:uncharacterized membrane protein